MQGRRLLVSVLVWLLGLGWGGALVPFSAVAQAGSPELDRLVDEALRNNPDVAAALARWEAAREQPAREGSLPDPELMAQVIRFRDRGLGVRSEGETWYSLRQEVPFPGKLGLRADVARYEADRTGRDYEAMRLDLIESVRIAYYHLLHAQLLIQSTAASQQIAERTMKEAQTRYELGSAPQQDVLVARVEHARIANELADLRRMRESAAAELNALLNRAADSELTVGEEPRPMMAPEPLDVDSLTALAFAQRPELAGAKYAAARDTLALRLARKAYLPDLFLGLEYWVGEGPNLSSLPDERYVLDVGLTVPWIWRGKHDAGVREAQARIRASRYELVEQANRIRREVETATADVEAAADQVRNFETSIMPDAALNLESATEAYVTDRGDFLGLLNAQRSLNELRIAQHTARVELLVAWARLERAVGTPPEGSEAGVVETTRTNEERNP